MTKAKKSISKASDAKEEQKKDEVITHTVTEQDLENNPDLVGSVKAGEEITIEEVKDTKAENDPQPTIEESEDADTSIEPNKQLSWEEAEALLNEGQFISRPHWLGFWFLNQKTGKINVFTKDSEILDNPEEEHKLEHDWFLVKPSEDFKVQFDHELSLKYKEIEDATFEPGDVIAYSISGSSSFKKCKIKIEDINDRSKYPADQLLSGKFLTENGFVFSREQNSFTSENGSEYLKQLKSK